MRLNIMEVFKGIHEISRGFYDRFMIVDTRPVTRGSPIVQWGGNAWERPSHTFVTFCFKTPLKLF